MKKLLLLLGGCLVADDFTHNVQAFGVDVFTSPDFSYQQRFFLDPAFTQPAPLNTVVWFVTSGDNVFSTNGTGGFGPGGVLTSDDTLIRQIAVDGDVPGALGPGYLFVDPFFIPDSNSNKNVFVYLWNRTTATTNTITPVSGDHFDVLSLGVPTPPALGNTPWYILQNLNANHLAVGVPEPEVLSLAGIGALCLILQRCFRSVGRQTVI